MRSSGPTNCPIQVGSLTAGRTRCAVTKSPGGESAAGRTTRSQPGRRGKDAGRRKTNYRRHRKGEPAGIADRAGDFGRRSSVLREKPVTIREETGREHLMARRCKRWWHALKVSQSNWGGSARFRQEEGLRRFEGVVPVNNQEHGGRRSPKCSGTEERLGISSGIRRKAESRSEAVQRVGDGHSSRDDKDNITLSMRRAISLGMFPEESGGPA
jgi:hypothetical protein